VTKGEDFDLNYADTITFKRKPVGTWMEYPITGTVQFFVDNPSQNNGVVIAVAMDDPAINHALAGQDTVYQGYCFAGVIPFVDSLKAYKPQLEIVYNENSSIDNGFQESGALPNESVYVNSGSINLLVPGNGKYSYSVFTISGKAIVKTRSVLKGVETNIRIDKAGMFILSIADNNRIVIRKIAVGN
jgi:hypothetical protein